MAWDSSCWARVAMGSAVDSEAGKLLAPNGKLRVGVAASRRALANRPGRLPVEGRVSEAGSKCVGPLLLQALHKGEVLRASRSAPTVALIARTPWRPTPSLRGPQQVSGPEPGRAQPAPKSRWDRCQHVRLGWLPCRLERCNPLLQRVVEFGDFTRADKAFSGRCRRQLPPAIRLFVLKSNPSSAID